jgi:hypothetical protein
MAPRAAVDGVVLRVPFGEAPLDGARVEALRDFVNRIAALEQPGRVEVSQLSGRFCLAGSAEAGYVLADAGLPADKCDLVAGSTDAAPGKAADDSQPFNAVLAELRSQHPALTIDVSEEKRDAPGRAYPQVQGGARSSSAGEWNAVAAANNRVEIRWHPAP